MTVDLERYRNEAEKELEDILSYWMKFTPDKDFGGFVGKIDHTNKIHPEAPKGSVLNSRILWTFSAAYNLVLNKAYLEVAHTAFEYLLKHFIDKEYGGVYWLVDHKGQPLDTKKQIYALSFAVYALSEYYKCTNDQKAKDAAIDLYNNIIRYSYDEKHGGYIEALTRDWKEIGDLRLSAKDANEKKSMNTHLHVLEAFTTLYQVWPDEQLKVRVEELVRIFCDHIIDQKTFHLNLFFDDHWRSKSGVVSYGHDIEAAWLVQEAAELLGGRQLINEVKEFSVQLATAAQRGLDKDGGLWYEYDPEKDHLIKEKHSWPQAEAMVGFLNNWQNTGDQKYLQQSYRSWEFVKKYMHDKTCGEWYWGVYEDYSPMNSEDKVGIWKCPYHNSRACIEIIRRIDSTLNKQQHEKK
jgi:mannobiose 2-epimerase